MDIAALSIQNSMANVQTQVGVAMLKKVMNTEADAVMSLIDSMPKLSQQMAAAVTGLGARVDIKA